MNKFIIRVILIANLLFVTSCTKTESKNDLNIIDKEEIVLPQIDENKENVEENADYDISKKENIGVKNKSPFDIIIIKKDEFGENIVLEKYNYNFSDSKLAGDELQYLIDIDMYFPQISMSNDKDLEYKINEKLKIPLLVFGNDENERITYFENLMRSEIRTIEAVYSSYEILFLSEDYLSINYTGDFGTSPICFMATIDLNTGDFLLLDETFDLDSIVLAIEQGEYELLEGSYNPGFGNGYEDSRKKCYIDSLKNGLNTYRMDKDEFTKYSPNSFSTDGTFLYIYASDDDTLNGYFILKLWLSDITSKIDFSTNSVILKTEMQTRDYK